MKGGQSVDTLRVELSSTPPVDRLTKVLSISALLLIILTWVSILFVLYFPFKELEIIGPIRVEPCPVAIGKEIKVSFHYIKFAKDAPEFSRSLINLDKNIVIDTHRSKAIRRPIGEGDFSFLFPIPIHKDAIGKCIIKLSFKYMKFGFREIDVDVQSKPFVVVDSDAR